MNREEHIRRFGEDEKMQQQHRKEVNANLKRWRTTNPDKVKADHLEEYCKGGKRYEKHLIYKTTGLPGEKERTRGAHANYYRPFKQIIAPDSQIHHEWIPRTSKYRGVALVEKDQHMHGFIDVLQILEGEITLLTEKGVGR